MTAGGFNLGRALSLAGVFAAAGFVVVLAVLI
jgi:hypothetical protein